MARDVLTVEDDRQAGEQLVRPVMRKGKRLQDLPTLAAARRHAAEALARLPEPLRRLAPLGYPVAIAPALEALAVEVDRRIDALRGVRSTRKMP